MRLCTDGYLDLRDNRRVRTPGKFDRYIEPAPEREALDFLFSHVFPNHRRIVRPISIGERRAMKLAIVAGSVGERMTLVDRVWRSMTQAMSPPALLDRPTLIQVVTYGDHWAYKVYLEGVSTRVVPHGLSSTELDIVDIPHLDFRLEA